ncbi:PREDICTED: Fanconi anemia group M protein [Chinchilla lanigera]|uniref:Fanconi anemia group M protein n=1 Tax=Chinchilla lanigera TaxID=34839 RepID=UPI000696BFAC|nr:PREDICTED: Fanconi anemia group M protein [Chinchilla lanigera]
MSGRQRTLFQTWGSSVSRSAGAPGRSSGAERPQGSGSSEPQPESDDDVLLVAVYEAERQQSLQNGGFCTSAGALWIYPTNCPVRDYQLHISRTALFCNTLVCLPTGLGKTFIAAVVMYNFYRWFPSGKVVFMAPTKPLVTQQIEACYRVMGIPQAHMAEMTGSTQAFTRKEIWRSKRVLFLTPQVMVNDLTRGACPAADIKCLVVDEAHKALGNYAYCQIVPASAIGAFRHGSVSFRNVPPLPFLKDFLTFGYSSAEFLLYLQILEAFASPLIHRNILMRRDISSLTKYQIILARDQFRKNPSPNIVGIQQGIIEGEFAICISLYHGYELLQQMGMRSLYSFLSGIMDGTKGMTRAKNELCRNDDFVKLYHHLESMFAHTCNTSAETSAVHRGDKDKNIFYSHPKLKKLEEVVVEHFQSWNAQKTTENKRAETRVMIFSSFRDSVQEIAGMLLKHKPVIRVMTFVGHASGKGMKGFTQKEQLEVVKRFRDGGYNTLVSTCVGEEGLDIGEVDLIICFDAQKSPIRLIQRMGRTGRKRQGRIVVVLAEGREERTYNQSQSNKRNIYKAISGSKQVLRFYQRSPRMVPAGINPELHKMFITHGVYEPEKPSRNAKRKSSLFPSRNGMRQNNSHEDWFLTEEEFKLWNTLYRLRDSDKIKEIALPQVHFPSLEEAESGPIPEPTPGTHQLSLAEWRVWQDHAFPTHQVGHSERCHHFVSVMQMIERMRHEEGECNYELEMKSYLQMEDVSSTFRTPGNPAKITHKKSLFTKNINQASSFSVVDSDEGCAEIFKQTHIKPTKIVSLMKIASKEMKKDQPNENNGDTDFLNTGRNSPVEPSFQVDVPDDKRSSDSSGVAATHTVNEKVANQPDVPLAEAQLINKSTNSVAGGFLDSGYGSFSDEKSVSSNLFLPFEEELSVSRTNDEFHPCHTLTKEVLANVERFLSHSPPPLSRLADLEYEIAKLENLPFLPHTERLHSCKSTSLMSYSAVGSQQDLELDSLKIINQPSERNCLFDANNDKISDEPYLFDREDELHKNIKNENLLSDNHVHIHTEPSKSLVDKNNHDVDNNDFPILSMDQNESLLLFEDFNEELNDTSRSPLKSNCKSFSVSDKTLVSEMAPVSQFLISDELLLDDNSEPQDQVIHDTHNCTLHADLKDTHEEKPNSDEYVFDCSRDLFSVTFDLGFCPDSDDEILEHTSDANKNRLVDDLSGKYLGMRKIKVENNVLNQSRDHVENFTNETIPIPSAKDTQSPQFALSAAKMKEFLSPGFSQFSLPVEETAMSTPVSKSNTLNSFSNVRKKILKTPDSDKKKNLQKFKETLSSTFDDSGFSLQKAKSSDQALQHQSCRSAEGEQLLINSESEDEFFLRRRKKRKGNVLKSPEDQNNSEIDSPVHAVKKRRVLRSELSSSDESENFNRPYPQLEEFKNCNKNARRGIKVQNSHQKHIARMFLDDEAELSEEDGRCISSDEKDDSENEQDSSMLEFLNDETQCSQAVNDSEMRAIYMKSLRSPLMNNKYRILQKKCNNMNVFSQIPEQDETYIEDSFCVDEEESCKSQSSEEEVCVDFNLITEECLSSGRKKYPTRHAVMLKQMKVKQNCARSKKKLSRVVLPNDSSEEENSVNDKRDSHVVVRSSAVDKSGCQEDPLDLKPAESAVQLKVVSNPGVGYALEDPCTSGSHCSNSAPHLAELDTSLGFAQEEKRTCILVDSSEITSGFEVISSLRAVHGFHVEVCSLNGGGYIVSNRMVVERRSQSEMANAANKSKLIEQIQHLQSMFERICVIVEKEREKTGDTSRMFRRTKSYDSLLTTLIGAGIRILFSSCQEETADLLKELSLVEQRKNVGIRVPTVVNSSKSEALQFYLSIPNISYITALNMYHQFSSVKKMANSSPAEISMYAQVTHQKAEEIYRYIQYVFDMQMLPNDLNQDRPKCDT